MGEGGGEYEELNGEQEHETLAFRRLVGAEDGEIPGCPDKNAEHDLVGDFDGDVGNEERNPGVGFGWSFMNFVERSLGDETRHDLKQSCQ